MQNQTKHHTNGDCIINLFSADTKNENAILLNQQALEILTKNITENEEISVIAVFGKVGTGKSTFLNTVANFILENNTNQIFQVSDGTKQMTLGMQFQTMKFKNKMADNNLQFCWTLKDMYIFISIIKILLTKGGLCQDEILIKKYFQIALMLASSFVFCTYNKIDIQDISLFNQYICDYFYYTLKEQYTNISMVLKSQDCDQDDIDQIKKMLANNGMSDDIIKKLEILPFNFDQLSSTNQASKQKCIQNIQMHIQKQLTNNLIIPSIHDKPIKISEFTKLLQKIEFIMKKEFLSDEENIFHIFEENCCEDQIEQLLDKFQKDSTDPTIQQFKIEIEKNNLNENYYVDAFLTKYNKNLQDLEESFKKSQNENKQTDQEAILKQKIWKEEKIQLKISNSRKFYKNFITQQIKQEIQNFIQSQNKKDLEDKKIQNDIQKYKAEIIKQNQVNLDLYEKNEKKKFDDEEDDMKKQKQSEINRSKQIDAQIRENKIEIKKYNQQISKTETEMLEYKIKQQKIENNELKRKLNKNFDQREELIYMTREELIYMTKICEQTERFEDMLEYIKKVVNNFDQELTVEERNLLSVAYKNSIGSRRTAWRAISSIEQKEESKGSKHLELIRTFKRKLESELQGFCDDILNLLERVLIKRSTNSESKVFYLKMKGDYYRYISEYAQGDLHRKVQQGAVDSYNAASDIANTELKTTHPIKLGLALNFSVFHYETLNDPAKACQLAKQAFDDAIADIEHIKEDQYKDATTIMQLIRDNLTLWTSEMNDDDGQDV